MPFKKYEPTPDDQKTQEAARAAFQAKRDAENLADAQQVAELDKPTGSGLQRGQPTVDGKIAGALQHANDKMKMDPYVSEEQLPERNRDSTYVGTNVSEFTTEQQDAIKKAIMDADSKKTVLPNGNTFGSIEDVKFQKDKDGSVIIEVQGTFADVDMKKLIDDIEGQKDKFRDVKIKELGHAAAPDMKALAAIAKPKMDGIALTESSPPGTLPPSMQNGAAPAQVGTGSQSTEVGR